MIDLIKQYFARRKRIVLIDSKGQQYNWRYIHSENANVPNAREKTISLDDLKSLIKARLPKLKPELYTTEQTFSGVIYVLSEFL